MDFTLKQEGTSESEDFYMERFGFFQYRKFKSYVEI